ncbi:MAG: hypothetical protein VB018_13280 [Lachnospiraceae bacterium]|nr:hypothetical protein [Lachnospiraceae bacterium]
MLRTMDILNAINRELVKKFPDRTVYIDRIPKNFERPSFLLEFVTTSLNGKNKNTVEVTEYYTITCYEETDRCYNSDTVKLIETQSDVLGIFRVGKLEVLDRCINIKASSSGRDEDIFYIDLQVEYFDERGLEEDESEIAENVIVNYKEV